MIIRNVPKLMSTRDFVESIPINTHLSVIHESLNLIYKGGDKMASRGMRTALFECGYCGKIFRTRIISVLTLHTTSCGCKGKVKPVHIGERFKRLTVVKKIDTSNTKCLCDCGNKVTVAISELRSSHRTSCGKCFNGVKDSYIEPYRQNCKLLTQRYDHMIQRLYYPNDDATYVNYALRGIGLSISRTDFIRLFYKNSSFNKNYEVDRINNNDDYNINNIRLVSKIENAKNKEFNYSVSLKDISNRLRTVNEFMKTLARKFPNMNISDFISIEFPFTTHHTLTKPGSINSGYSYKLFVYHKNFDDVMDWIRLYVDRSFTAVKRAIGSSKQRYLVVETP